MVAIGARLEVAQLHDLAQPAEPHHAQRRARGIAAQLRGGMQLMVKTLDGKTVTVSQNSGQLCLLAAMP